LNNSICLYPSRNIDGDGDSFLHSIKCDSIYVNLLQAKFEKNFMASFFVREFFETARCDKVYNMTDMRQKYAAKINVGDPNRMCRVLNHEEDPKDESFATQVNGILVASTLSV
jgi:hypothetical protein